MKKKPTKKSKLDKKKSWPILNALHPDFSANEIHLWVAEKRERVSRQSRNALKKSIDKRRKDPFKSFGEYNWSHVEKLGQTIHKRNSELTRSAIAKHIKNNWEDHFLSCDRPPGVRSISDHLKFISTDKDYE